MFAGTSDARDVRKRLKRHISAHGSSKGRAQKYMRGPFAPFHGSAKGAPPSDNVEIDIDHRRAVDAVSRNLLIAGPLRIVSQASMGEVKIMRGDEPVRLKPAFERFVCDLMERLAAEILHSLLVYGLCVVVFAPKPRSPHGIAPLQHSGATSVREDALVLDLADDRVSISFTEAGGGRLYDVRVDGMDLEDRDDVVLSVLDAPNSHGLLQSLTANLVGTTIDLESHFALNLSVSEEQVCGRM
jgi:hypothetical protein